MASTGQRPLSVGLFLPLWEESTSGKVPAWTEVLARAQLAEAVGFDSIWLPDHLILRFPDAEPEGVWEGWTVLAALAAATKRIALGPLVACTSFRNPALLAKMADTVDEISGGRLILGLGAGWHEPEYRAYGFPFDHRVSRFEEALKIIHGLLRHGQIDFEGTYYSARECELRPRGPRPEGPPIMIGSVSPRMLGLVARYADLWNVYFSTTQNSASNIPLLHEKVDAACRDAGRDPATLGRTVAAYVDFTDTPGGTQSFNGSGAPALTGTPEEIAVGLRAYAEVGIEHVQVHVLPMTTTGIERFAPVLEALDRT
ncbi:MAG: LLM class flavin-dependent oxidoreductase [Chloroflexia bacterium]|nr:LLM class flavin-dependent oxidoreductase [Chloroflexia bacterium]